MKTLLTFIAATFITTTTVLAQDMAPRCPGLMTEALKLEGVETELKKISFDDNAKARRFEGGNSVGVVLGDQTKIIYYNNSELRRADKLSIEKDGFKINLLVDNACSVQGIEFEKKATYDVDGYFQPVGDLITCVNLRDKLSEGAEKELFAQVCKGILNYKWAPVQLQRRATGLIFDDEKYNQSPRKTNPQ